MSEFIEYMLKNEITEHDIHKAIGDYITIENKNKEDVIDVRNILQHNSTTMFKTFNDYILNMNESKNQLDYYKDSDISEIFGVTVTTVKNWRKQGRLTYEQKSARHSVKISKNAIEMFVRDNPQYERRWKVNKNNYKR